MGKHSPGDKPRRFRMRPAYAVLALAGAIIVTGASVGVASLNNATMTLHSGDSLGVKCVGSSLKFSRTDPATGKVKCVPTPPPTTSSTSTVPPTSTSTVVPPPPPTSTTKSSTSTSSSTSTVPPSSGPPPARTCSNPTDTFTEGEGGSFGKYYVHNNTWNLNSGNHETLYACDFNNWYVDASGMSGTSVKTYPNVHVDFNNMNGVPFGSLPQITSTFAGVGPAGGIYDVAYDLWLNGVADNNSTELMVWTQNRQQVPSGDILATYTAGGMTYDVWTDKQGYIAFVARSTMLSGTVDLKAMINFAISKGYMPANPSVNQIDYGIEYCSTGGATQRFTVSDFSLTTN